MDNSIMELDSFTVEMLKRVNEHKKYLDEILNSDDENDDENSDGAQLKKAQCVNVKEEKVDDSDLDKDDDQNVDEDEDDDFDDDLLNDNYKQHVRESIHKLLNVHEPLYQPECVSNEKSNAESTRLNKRLNHIAALYEDEPTSSKVLTEKNLNLKDNVHIKSEFVKESVPPIKKGNLKDRLNEIARSYYPVLDEQDKSTKEPIVEAKSENSNLTSIKSESAIDETTKKEGNLVKENLFKFKSLAFENKTKNEVINKKPKVFESNSAQVKKDTTDAAAPVRKTSVADLKKMFEAKSEEMMKPKEIAPELLSLRDKKRLFEKAIKAENEAFSKQYKKQPVPLKRIIDWEPNANKDDMEQNNDQEERVEQPEVKRQKSDVQMNVESEDDSMVSENDDAKLSPQHHSNMIECGDEQPDSFNEHSKPELEIGEETAHESVQKAFETIDNYTLSEVSVDEITFNTIDKTSAQSNFVVSMAEDKLYPELAVLNDSDKVHRSSTRTNLKADDSVNSKGQNSTCSIAPEKPPRLYLYENNEPEPNEMEEVPIRTISFYRREQKMRKDAEACNEYLSSCAESTVSTVSDNDGHHQPVPAKVIYLKQKLTPDDDVDFTEFRQMCQNKVDALKQEITEHNRIMSQASTALNMCMLVPDLQQSTGRVEAERLLLISAEKRSACLAEIARLKSMTKHPEKYANKVSASTKGTINITNLRIPLRNDFVISRAKGKITSTHYFICLICHGPKIFVSELLNTGKNMASEYLEFNFGLNVTELSEDFSVLVKLFSFELCKEQKQSKKTPLLKKSFKMKFSDGGSSKLSSPMKSSNASTLPASSTVPKAEITSTNFVPVGYVTLNLANVRKTQKFYRLESFPMNSPIDGYITMNVKLNVTHQYTAEGFFDMQDSKTSFWNLRWFVIRGEQLLYWRFPDEMSTKSALGVINLKHCINSSVGFLKANQRHLCMRPNTFVLVTIVPPPVSNAQKLVKGGTITKPVPEIFYISSQSKEDSVNFCAHINRVLKNIRTWETDAIRPYSTEEFDRLILNTH